jgi:hypothetical protein
MVSTFVCNALIAAQISSNGCPLEAVTLSSFARAGTMTIASVAIAMNKTKMLFLIVSLVATKFPNAVCRRSYPKKRYVEISKGGLCGYPKGWLILA